MKTRSITALAALSLLLACSDPTPEPESPAAPNAPDPPTTEQPQDQDPGTPPQEAPIPTTVVTAHYPDWYETVSLFVHDASGAFVKRAELDEDNVARIEDMPAGGAITLALAQGDDRRLATALDVNPGDELSMGNDYNESAYADLTEVEVSYTLPANLPAGVGDISGTIGCLRQWANDTSDTFTATAPCAQPGAEVPAVFVAYDTEGTPIAYVGARGVTIEESTTVDLSAEDWRTDFAELSVAAHDALGNNTEVEVMGWIGETNTAQDGWSQETTVGGSFFSTLRLPAAFVDSYVVWAGQWDGGEGTSWRLSHHESDLSAGAITPYDLDLEDTLPIAGEVDATVLPPSITATPMASNACDDGEIVATILSLDARYVDGGGGTWTAYGSDETQAVMPDLPADEATYWWAHKSFDSVRPGVMYMSSTEHSAEDFRSDRSFSWIEANYIPSVGHTICFSQRGYAI